MKMQAPRSRMKTKLLLLVLLVVPVLLRAQAPGIITYQGRITNSGTSFTGTGQFRFVIYRTGLPATTYWSHDNSSVSGGMPVTALALPVTNGLFAVGLGDTTVPGAQSPIPASIFTNSGLRVRIWFSDGVVAPAIIADHAITSTGYALLAMGVPDASITSAKLANGNVTTAKIATGAVTSAQLADDISLTNLRLAGTGFGNGTETVTLDAATGAGQGALFTLRNGGGTPTWVVDADTTLGGSSMSFFDPFGQRTVTIDSHSSVGAGGGLLEMSNHLNQRTVSLDADASGTAGALSLFNSAGSLTVVVDGSDGSDDGGVIGVYNHSGSRRAELDGEGLSGGGELWLKADNGTTTVLIQGAEVAGNGAQIALYRAAGGGASIVLDADYGGEGRITTQVLEITGGSDFSEAFDIRSGGAQPGMLVRIDAAHPGELAVADRAYDRAVAGVVSGAGGVKPGVMMGQRGTAADGQHPVALTGRVYCLVDAERGAIEPGDLITTSDTPGHGMKVRDHARAQGAIVGKAMTRLASGRGLVLVLVSLQ